MRRRGRRKDGKASSVEFSVALVVFFLVILFPLINLIGFAMGAGTLYFLVVQCGVAASGASTYSQALTNMEAKSKEIAATGLGKFASLAPVGGFNGSGTDLYVIETSVSGGDPTKHGPNTPLTGTIDPNSNVYEYEVRATFNVGPFMNLSALPFVGTVPGIGSPVRLSMTADRHVEFTEGLSISSNQRETKDNRLAIKPITSRKS